ncbi:hypothetical protein IscW_ISCW010928, partial [Ixodes scapularis]
YEDTRGAPFRRLLSQSKPLRREEKDNRPIEAAKEGKWPRARSKAREKRQRERARKQHGRQLPVSMEKS